VLPAEHHQQQTRTAAGHDGGGLHTRGAVTSVGGGRQLLLPTR